MSKPTERQKLAAAKRFERIAGMIEAAQHMPGAREIDQHDINRAKMDMLAAARKLGL